MKKLASAERSQIAALIPLVALVVLLAQVAVPTRSHAQDGSSNAATAGSGDLSGTVKRAKDVQQNWSRLLSFWRRLSRSCAYDENLSKHLFSVEPLDNADVI